MSCPHGNHPDTCDTCAEVDAAHNSGLHAGLLRGASIARQLFVQHCHHHGVDGLLKRCEEAEQKLIELANAADDRTTAG